MFIHNRLTQQVAGIIMPIVRRQTVQNRVWCRIPEFTQCAQLVSWHHTTVVSTSRLTKHKVL